MGLAGELLAYRTRKTVVVRDQGLGALRLCCLLVIFLYVFVYTILVSGRHLQDLDAEGVFGLALQHPTSRMCNPYQVGCRQNFTDMSELAYCEQSQGDSAGLSRPCAYMDATELLQRTDRGIMVPTRVESFEQTRGCAPSELNGWKCGGPLWNFVHPERRDDPNTTELDESLQRGGGPATPKRDVFVADVERFTLVVEHSLRAGRGQLSLEHREMGGFWWHCPSVPHGASQSTDDCVREPIFCVRDQCPEASARLSYPQQRRALRTSRRQADLSLLQEAASPHGQPALAMTKGDVFSLKHLLRMAHVDLDRRAGDAASLRARGVVLVLHLEYTNILPYMGLQVLPWRRLGPTPWYTYRLTQHPASEVLARTLETRGDRQQRTVHEWRGIRFVVSQTAAIKAWDTISFLVVLTTALLLFALATYFTDLLAVWVFKHDLVEVQGPKGPEASVARNPVQAVRLS